jgi:hypothetical protein
VIKIKQRELPGRQSQAYNILSLIAISGELPVNQIKRLPGGCKHKTDLIKDLKRKKYITTYYNDKLRGYRLTANSKDMLIAENGKRFESFFSGSIDTNQPKYEIKRRLRLKSIAETFVTMQNAGVAIYKDEKPDVFYPETDPEQTLSVTAPVFYNSREIKNCSDEFNKILRARSVGALLTDSKIFIVYNTCGSLMRWSNKSEITIKGFLRHILGIERLPQQYQKDEIRGLMLGDSMEQAYQLITSTGGLRKRDFMLDNTYDYFLYLPNDRNGEIVLRLLCDTEKTEELNSILSQGLNEHNPGMFTVNDAIDENGDPVLFAYDCDMHRIFKFNSGLTIHDRKGTIICFDFQADVLKRYCCENVIFQIIDTEKFERRFFP